MSAVLRRLPKLLTAIFFAANYTARWGFVVGLFAIGAELSGVSTCFAGGGPENVLLVVNSTSQDSMAVANEYIALRNIPANNVFYIAYKKRNAITSGALFRTEILLPLLAEIKQRKLAEQIDYVVYSCDFPWRVSFAADFPTEKFRQPLAPHGSLTGMTYLNAFVTEKRKEVVSLSTNWYFMEPMRGLTISRAFRSQYRWAIGGRRTGGQGLTYMISSMLGVTFERGNKVAEIIHSLRLAKKADGTKPPGTVYFMKHNGPRSKPRDGLFNAAAAELRRLGVTAKVLEGKFPKNKTGIAGLTTGTAFEDLKAAGCRFLPGAFCDNLTSSGARFFFPKPRVDVKTGKKRRGQLSIADFIRHGATAASGTVFEPHAIRQKFPLPSVHVHYANGCSLGEAFYQSVSGPYQQLLVGDPLCQPWATIPVVLADEIAQGTMLHGEVEITPHVGDEKNPIKEFELYVDGLRIQRCQPGKKFLLDTTTFRDGHHELRIVARDDTPIETQGRLLADITIKNGRDAIGLTTKQKKLSVADKSLVVEVVSTTKATVEVFFNRLKLGNLPTGSGTLRIALDQLGSGPVELVAQSESLRSKPLQLKIDR